MHPDMASALAGQHRHAMTAKAGHHAQATQAVQAGETAEACRAAHPGPATPAGRGTLLQAAASPASRIARGGLGAGLQAAASPRGPRRGARRPHLPGVLLPRYRVSWSRTALSTAAADGARRGHSWVIVISATRTL
jgi:hypothetical protein